MKHKRDKFVLVKIEVTPVDLSNLSDVVKGCVVKKTEFEKLFKSINKIKTTDTSDLIKKAVHDTK